MPCDQLCVWTKGSCRKVVVFRGGSLWVGVQMLHLGERHFLHLLVSNLIDSNFPGKWQRPTASKPDAWLCIRIWTAFGSNITLASPGRSRGYGQTAFQSKQSTSPSSGPRNERRRSGSCCKNSSGTEPGLGSSDCCFGMFEILKIIATPEVICDVQSHHQPHHIHHGHHQLLSWVHVCSSCSCWAGVGLRVRYLGWLGEAWNCWMSLITVIQHKHLTLSLRVLWNFQSTPSQKRGRNSKTAAFNAAWLGGLRSVWRKHVCLLFKLWRIALAGWKKLRTRRLTLWVTVITGHWTGKPNISLPTRRLTFHVASGSVR